MPRRQRLDIANNELESRIVPSNTPELVRDINTSVLPTGSNPANFVNVNGIVFITANVPGYGVELWKSDGTFSGTTLVRDINLGSASSTPRFLTNANGLLFFRANDEFGTELWRSDGTSAGT